MSGDETLVPLVNPGDPLQMTYLPAAYGDGRFEVVRRLATAGQGYTLLVRDTWTGGYGVLKGLWWPVKALNEPQRATIALERNNAQIRQGVEAVRRATQLNQQAPVVVTTVHDPSPAQRAMGHADVGDELFAVQQFVGVGAEAASTLRTIIEERKAEGRRFRELELLDLAAQLCDTLAALHGEWRARDGGRSRYWVHADIKPGNILVLGPPWRYILIDYDGAVEQGAQIQLTTEPYSPPVRVGGQRERDAADERFDIYMFGATLAEAAGLQRLDDRTREQLYGSKQEHADGKKVLRSLGYGPILTTVIASCMAPPNTRFRDAGLVAADLALARNAEVLSGLLTSDDWT
ncbi:phosphotransferase [Dactylosporangium sp. AC04546]|uniref:phosphotransferase n=1 Tax=Dactylosporangium sp. AC04546 TaxID=2862460 RepID=UPI001EDF2F8D|nr:phosphotransferase [Dactylosporangium sp. AC04546]WVK86393.1 phosphotransferase [Dactylosporangium sp. AC04546]